MKCKNKKSEGRRVDCLSVLLEMRKTTAMLPSLKKNASHSYESKLFEGVLNGFILLK